MAELITREIEKALEKLDKEEIETNQKATERISNELKAAKKLDLRRSVVMGYFFELTGMPMPLKWFNEYNKIFDDEKTPAGYNIKSFIWTKQQEILKFYEEMADVR
jgi:hypothetical protein